MKIEMKASITVNHSTTAADLKSNLDGIPDRAKVKIVYAPYYNQFDAGYTRIDIEWTEER